VKLVRVALDVPLAECFDFTLPDGLDVPAGALVVVPFGRTRKVGVVVGHPDESPVEAARLRPIQAVVEDVAPFTPADLELFEFCAAYYQRPLGEVIATSLPPRLRQVSRRALEVPAPRAGAVAPAQAVHAPNEAQAQAIRACLEGRDRFHPVLLQGVTGSGKTEVYLHLMADALARGRQALMLVPEIGLTPQLEAHVRTRFPDATVIAAHSHLGQGERAAAWLAAQSGAAHIVLGTRLAVLMPFRDLGLIVIDEEHDP